MTEIQTLTLDQATELVPAIGATRPADSVSDRYQFVSSREILQRVMQDGWRITNATSQGRSQYAQHRVTLVHENELEKALTSEDEGIPRIEMFNSHNLTKRLMFAIGFFRFVCSNGLMVATGPAEAIRTKHRFTDDRLEQIMGQVSEISGRFPVINEKIAGFKSRELTDSEQASFAEYAIKGRFNYRPAIPKRFRDTERVVERLLTSRRDEDKGNSTWQVFNRVQENLIMGMDGFSRPIRGYTDSTRVNQLLWKGAETTMKFNSESLRSALMTLIVKDKQKGKISA
jgi:hypothetical protein